MKQLRIVLCAALGGAWGGSLVGLLEASLISTTSSPEEFWLFPFAVVSYGAIGFGAGIGVAALIVVSRALSRRARSLSPLGLGAAVAFVPLGFAIARYHVGQRVFQEGLALASPTGVAVHLGLLVAVCAVAALVYRGGHALDVQRSGVLCGIAGWVFVLGASVLAALFAEPSADAAVNRRADPAAAARPNVVLFVVDTLRADAIERHLRERDGGIARIARDGTVFTNAHSQASWTRPSMASLFTSLYPSQHGAMHKTSVLPERVTTIAEAFASAGYWTAGFTTNINLAPIFNFQQGFDEYAYLEPNFYFGATDAATRLAIYKGLRVAREKLFRDRIFFQNYYQDAQVVNAAVSGWLAQAPPQPFFLFVHYMDPHDPYFEMPYNGRGVARVTDQNPDPARAAELHGLYGQGVDYIEAELGRLLDELHARGLYEQTVIAVTADHGEEFQEHDGWWHGTTLYQEQLHVPLVIKTAGARRAPAVDEQLVELVDVAPTLLRAAGLDAPRVFAGRDILQSGATDLVFAEEDHEGNRLVALRKGDWKIIVANPDNPRGLQPVEVYDLASDPGETRNLAPTEPERVEELMRELGQRRDSLRRSH